MKQAVLVIWDSLRADFVCPEYTPRLAATRSDFCEFKAHTTVFPSTTRTASASIATGCLPARHGLHGNAMALNEGHGLVSLSTGKADFVGRMRKATGRTLRVPTLAQRLARADGSIVFSNASPGAAFFQDPDGHGFLYNRAGSYGPGLKPVAPEDALTVAKGVSGDQATTDRFCEEVLKRRRPALSVLWLSEPDHTGHRAPLAGPEHRAAMAGSDACFARVVETVDRYLGEDTLILTGSDHGNETTDRVIPVEQTLVAAGLKRALDSSDVVVAPQGTAALIYLAEDAKPRLVALREFFASRDWVGSIVSGSELGELGLETGGALAMAVSMRKSAGRNPFGIPGMSDLMLDRGEDLNHVGCGQHGGMGPWETAPFLMARGPSFRAGTIRSECSSVIDIAPTIMRHLDQSAEGMDGRALQDGFNGS